MTRFALLFPLLIAACVEAEAPPVADVLPPDTAQSCGADALQDLVGRPATVLHTMKFGTQTRIIRPGMAVTMDHRIDRLNITIDAAEMISRVACG